MKLKKFFAGVVAAAMMLTMGATAAFADDAPTKQTKAVNNGGSFTLTKTLTANEDSTWAAIPATTKVEFEVKDKGVQPAATENNALPSIAPVTVTNGNGTITVQLPKYLQVDTYTYTITENAPEAAGVNQNTKTYTMTVYVLNADSNSTAANKDLTCKVKIDEDNGKTKIDDIANTYDAGKLIINKKVTGNSGNRDEDFTFTVEFKSEKAVQNNIKLSLTSSAKVTSGVDANANVTFSTDSETKISTATVVITMKHGDTATFLNVPNGVKYTVKETAANGYTTYVNGEAEKDKVSAESGYITLGEQTFSASKENHETSVNYFNYKNDGNVDTGVILDNAPYIALMAIVVFGGVALMLNKRRRDEE